MPIIKRIQWVFAFFLLLALLFIFRFQLTNRIQQRILSGLDKETALSNRALLSNGAAHQDHGIYGLSGKGRIWPHRVNSFLRFTYLYPYFPGFECDIRFNSGGQQLFVAHDSTEINTLTFVDYLKADPDHKLFWLDVKNLSDANRQAFAAQMQALDSRFNIKNRVILESSDTASLAYLNGLGFLTSYYIPGLDIPESINRKKLISGIRGFLEQHPMLISQDIRMQVLMEKYFPGRLQLCWDLAFLDGMSRKVLSQRAKDSNLLLCLINVKSPGYQ